MTTDDIRTAYYNALLALFKTSPDTPANTAACAECARLYDLAPEVCDDLDDAIMGGFRMDGGAA